MTWGLHEQKLHTSVNNDYFENLAVSLENIPAQNIYNYDETNLTDDPESKTVQ